MGIIIIVIIIITSIILLIIVIIIFVQMAAESVVRWLCVWKINTTHRDTLYYSIVSLFINCKISFTINDQFSKEGDNFLLESLNSG